MVDWYTANVVELERLRQRSETILYLLDENKRLNKVNEQMINELLIDMHKEYSKLYEYESDEVLKGFEIAIKFAYKKYGVKGDI